MQVHQRGFAGAGRPHDGDVFAALDFQRNVAQRVDGFRAHLVAPRNFLEADEAHESFGLSRCPSPPEPFMIFLPSSRSRLMALITAGDNFLAFLQAVGDFPVIVVADADFHRHHFHVVAFDDEHHVHRLVSVIRLFVGLVANWSRMSVAAMALVGDANWFRGADFRRLFAFDTRVVTLAMGTASTLVR